MAIRGNATYMMSDDGLRDIECDSGVSVVRRKRPGTRPTNRRDRTERRWAAWAIMRQAGMTFDEIASCTGCAVSTIHEGISKVESRGLEVLKARMARSARYGL
jgi:DNA invertase Pin-like site-specific DNA recombinase